METTWADSNAAELRVHVPFQGCVVSVFCARVWKRDESEDKPPEAAPAATWTADERRREPDPKHANVHDTQKKRREQMWAWAWVGRGRGCGGGQMKVVGGVWGWGGAGWGVDPSRVFSRIAVTWPVRLEFRATRSVDVVCDLT